MYKKKKIVALITARANSQRLKKKNFLTIFKKPLIFWTISSTKSSCSYEEDSSDSSCLDSSPPFSPDFCPD